MLDKHYAQIILDEGGQEFNLDEQAYEALLDSMCIIYRIGEAEAHNADPYTQLLITLVSDKIPLLPSQMERLKQYAFKWAKLAYEDGASIKY